MELLHYPVDSGVLPEPHHLNPRAARQPTICSLALPQIRFSAKVDLVPMVPSRLWKARCQILSKCEH